MRFFAQIFALLFALLACASADDVQYDATVYITSTVYRVATVYQSGSPPFANATGSITPSNTAALPSGPSSTNAAGALNVNLAAALVAGLGYLVL